MHLNIQILKMKTSKATDEVEIDELAVRWLRNLADDHGKDGATASKLLDVVASLLDIDA